METLAILGLASNVLQFISFTHELITTTRSISRDADGQLVENREIEAMARRIEMLSSSISRSVEPSTTEEGRALNDICNGCQEVARKLIEKIDGLKSNNTKSGKTGQRLADLRMTLRSVLAADGIKDLEEKLDRYQTRMHTSILAGLIRQISDAEKTKEIRDEAMSRHLLGSIDDTKQWQAELIDTISQNNWNSNSEHDVKMFSERLERGVHGDQEARNKRRILLFLRFDGIEGRYETIKEKWQQTFEWMFQSTRPTSQGIPDVEDDQERGSTPQWDDFPKWLQGEEDLYWVTGKPGSGKSTLMKSVFDDTRSLQSALQWSGQRELVRAGFFFWNSGTPMQRSRMGLLQTLLHQCLVNHGDLIPEVFRERYERYALFGVDKQPWTMRELTEAFKNLLSIDNMNFLIFIDGLDEFEGKPQVLVDWVLDLKKSSKAVKFCVSSRPWPDFEERFQSLPKLRMHDLTRADVQIFVDESLQKNQLWIGLRNRELEQTTKMVQSIIDKAKGVFLWVTLVVTSLLYGVRDGDLVQELWLRIEDLPEDLEALFEKILEDLKESEDWRKSRELLLLMTAAFKPLTVLDMFFAVEGCEMAIDAPLRVLSDEITKTYGETMHRRIISRTKGLLEVEPGSQNVYDAKIGYLHRTVKDFLENEKGSASIRSGSLEDQSHLLLAASYLRQLKTTARRDHENSWNEFWHPAQYSMTYLSKYKSAGNPLSMRIVEEIDKTGQDFWGSARSGLEDDNNWLKESLDWHYHYGDYNPSYRQRIRHITESLTKDLNWTATISLADMSDLGPATVQNNSRYNRDSFMKLAIAADLGFWVQAKLTPQALSEEADWEKGLLECAIHGKSFSVIPVLLKKGANPNRNTENPMFVGWTLWKFFLLISKSSSQNWSDIVMSFVDHGAELSLLMENYAGKLDGLPEEDRNKLFKRAQLAQSPPGGNSSSSRSSSPSPSTAISDRELQQTNNVGFLSDLPRNLKKKARILLCCIWRKRSGA